MAELSIEKLNIFQNKVINLVYPENFRKSTFFFVILSKKKKRKRKEKENKSHENLILNKFKSRKLYLTSI